MRTLNDSRGYFKMHWEVFDMLENPTVALLLEYLIEVAPTKRERRVFDGEEYVRMSNAFIQDRLNLSDSTIKRYLDILEKEGFIKIKTIKSATNKARYLKINTEVISEYDSEYDSEYGSEYKSEYDSEYGSKRTNKETKKIRKEEPKEKKNDVTKNDSQIPLLEDIISYYESFNASWLTKEDVLGFYNSVIYRGWKKANGEPISDWKSYFKWFIEKDKPATTAKDRDPGKVKVDVNSWNKLKENE